MTETTQKDIGFETNSAKFDRTSKLVFRLNRFKFCQILEKQDSKQNLNFDKKKFSFEVYVISGQPFGQNVAITRFSHIFVIKADFNHIF